ncbi:helix-turn-helix domain-containing protein [Amaricoccus sp.]|uniref:helix-turn-helix domain-containing protein n=1 Tax=Amaricoccus sp. TaxID=1872485 RepID=UPI001B657200|nr:helix-turn-helix domain-containing protein [Amaricoccus sp.]MBP7001674.1 helix-turn-helix domain-containing protein [Amaricoccus sp.]
MPNQASRGDVLAHVGTNLRRLRQAAGMSQQALAEASGISRRMIVGLEGGETNVSLSSLDRLAWALGAGFVEMVSDPDAGLAPGRVEALAWRGRAEGSSATLVGSVPARRDAQLWTWSLAPGDRYDAEPDPEGWHEIVHVDAGVLTVETEAGELTIGPGGHAIYGSAQSYAYANRGTDEVRFIRVVVA